MQFFVEELKTIGEDILLMGEKALEMTRLAIRAILESDVSLGEHVISMDDDMDDLEKKIDHECLRYLSLRAPVATDVRKVTMAMKACQDFERIGDEACSISKRVRKMCKRQGKITDPGNIPEMEKIVINQLRSVVDAFLNGDSTIMERIVKEDERLDKLHRKNLKNIPQQESAEPNELNSIVDFAFISKSIERIGDHAVNIAEEVVFLVDAKDVRHTHS